MLLQGRNFSPNVVCYNLGHIGCESKVACEICEQRNARGFKRFFDTGKVIGIAPFFVIIQSCWLRRCLRRGMAILLHQMTFGSNVTCFVLKVSKNDGG